MDDEHCDNAAPNLLDPITTLSHDTVPIEHPPPGGAVAEVVEMEGGVISGLFNEP
jgi:hypothetical protein